MKIIDFFMFKCPVDGVGKRYYYVEWSMRLSDGMVPMDSFVTEDEIEAADEGLLLRFLHE